MSKGIWKLYVSVPSKAQAIKDARAAKKWGDASKVAPNKNGGYDVFILNPSEGARIILGL